MKNSNNTERQNKEHEILVAAEQEFLTKGFDGARTTSIAQAAGVTHAMLHYYFRTKEQLFERIVDDKFAQMSHSMFVMFFFIMIFMLMSGLLTPIDSMPEWAQRFTLILPPRYYIEILRSVYLKGTSIAELWTNFAALGGFALFFNTLAALTYKKRS